MNILPKFKTILKDVCLILTDIIKHLIKMFGFGILAILMYSPILALGIYLSMKTGLNWIWGIALCLYLVCFYITYSHLNNKYNPD